MRRILFAVLLLLLVLHPVSALADQQSDPSAADWIGGKEPTQKEVSGEPVSGWSFLLQVVFALGLVILLIILLLRFLANRQLGGIPQGPFRVIGVVPLGSGKTMQIVSVGDSIYLLGVGEDVHLLRHIPAGEEADLILAEAVIKPSAANRFSEWLSQLRSGKSVDEGQSQSYVNQSFEDLLQREWKEMGNAGDPDASWPQDNQTRGDRS